MCCVDVLGEGKEMKAQFSSTRKNKKDGIKLQTTVRAEVLDLTKDMGEEYLFIDTISREIPDGYYVRQEISMPKKDLRKLIKTLQKLVKK
jgi:hypothetical protein